MTKCEKQEKLNTWSKKQNMSQFGKHVTRFYKVECMLSILSKTCHDGKNVTRFWKP